MLILPLEYLAENSKLGGSAPFAADANPKKSRIVTAAPEWTVIPMPDPFRPPSYQVAFCADCGKEDLKRNMKTICVKDLTGTMKTFCHLCEGCFRDWVSGLDIKQTTTTRRK